jgi:nitrogen fixation/metabolism regulation signal transduction histidine kinase
LIFANLVSGGIIRSVRLLLEGARAVEAGQLDQSIDVRATDEIGQLAAAFNRMIVHLRNNQRSRKHSENTSIRASLKADRSPKFGGRRRPAPGDDCVVLRLEGLHQP